MWKKLQYNYNCVSISNYCLVYLLVYLIIVLIYNVFMGVSTQNVRLLMLTSIINFIIVFIIEKRKNKYLSTSLFFLFSFLYCIVFFQKNIDYMLGIDLDEYQFYDINIINPALCFSLLCFNIFLVGYIWPKRTSFILTKMHVVPIKGLSVVLIILLVLFGVLMRDKLNERVEGIKGIEYSIFGHLMNVLYALIIQQAWNALLMKRMYTIKLFFKSFNLVTWLTVFFVTLYVLNAGGRSVVIAVLMLFFYLYIIFRKVKLSFIKVLITMVVLAIITSLLKIFGGIGYFFTPDFSDIGSSLEWGYEVYNKVHPSIIPMTDELARSVYSYNILYDAWTNDHSMNMTSLIISFVRLIPGGVRLLQYFYPIESADLNSSDFATEYANETYGVGTTVIGDALINGGWLFCIVMIFFLGWCFSKVDYMIQRKDITFNLFVLGCVCYMNVVFLCRGSIGNIITNYFYILMILYLNRKINIFTSKE